MKGVFMKKRGVHDSLSMGGKDTVRGAWVKHRYYRPCARDRKQNY